MEKSNKRCSDDTKLETLPPRLCPAFTPGSSPIATIGNVASLNTTCLSASDCCFAFANSRPENWIGRLGSMPEKPRFGGAAGAVWLLILGARFRAATAIYSVENLKIRIVLMHITDGRCGELVVFTF